LDRVISLEELKKFKEKELKGMQMFSTARLSVQNVSDAEWDFILGLEKAGKEEKDKKAEKGKQAEKDKKAEKGKQAEKDKQAEKKKKEEEEAEEEAEKEEAENGEAENEEAEKKST
jgi:hypothetical protein